MTADVGGEEAWAIGMDDATALGGALVEMVDELWEE